MTVREVLKARLERARQRKTQLQADLAACQAEIDATKAELDGLTAPTEAQFERLQTLKVIEAKD